METGPTSRADLDYSRTTKFCEAMITTCEFAGWQGGPTLPLDQMWIDTVDAPIPIPFQPAAAATWRRHRLLQERLLAGVAGRRVVRRALHRVTRNLVRNVRIILRRNGYRRYVAGHVGAAAHRDMATACGGADVGLSYRR